MKSWLLPSGRQCGIPFILPEDWTPELALAVVELLDDLRQIICAHYQIPLHELLREQYMPPAHDQSSTTEPADPPF
ncbi:MAG: hypothetical protein WCF44_20655 [Candidatus Methylophosphatis roskildensis]